MGRSCKAIKLNGLGKDSMKILEDSGLKDQEEWSTLIDQYRGNPLALRLVANRINRFFGGSVAQFHQYRTTTIMFDYFEQNLSRLIGGEGAISDLGKQILVKISASSDKVGFKEMLQLFVQSESQLAFYV